jgi:hypothetical protein
MAVFSTGDRAELLVTLVRSDRERRLTILASANLYADPIALLTAAVLLSARLRAKGMAVRARPRVELGVTPRAVAGHLTNFQPFRPDDLDARWTFIRLAM